MKRLLPLAVIAVLLPLQGCVLVALGGQGGGRGPLHMETLVPREKFFSAGHVLLIDLAGEVSVSGSSGLLGGSGPGMLVQLKDRLAVAEEDPGLRAIVLRVNSPGGGVTASDLIYHELKAFKKEKPDIPVIALMTDVAASGGVYISMAADEIYALPTAVTGSIGVITMMLNLEGIEETLGVSMRVIKSGKVKDIGSPWRPMTDEERAIMQALIDSMYNQFIDVILEGRTGKGLTREALLKFADGRVFDAKTAVANKLIDGVRYPEDVFERAMALANAEGIAVVSYEYRGSNRRGNVYAESTVPTPTLSLPSEVNLLNVDLGLGSLGNTDSRFMYLWIP